MAVRCYVNVVFLEGRSAFETSEHTFLCVPRVGEHIMMSVPGAEPDRFRVDSVTHYPADIAAGHEAKVRLIARQEGN
jgi:hypothetical protein